MHTSPTCYLIFAAHSPGSLFFFFNDTATTEIYTLSLHDALPISPAPPRRRGRSRRVSRAPRRHVHVSPVQDRKSTRLNSSHGYISYAVFCLKKKKKHTRHTTTTEQTHPTQTTPPSMRVCARQSTD